MSQELTDIVSGACRGAFAKAWESHVRDVEELREYCEGGPPPERAVPLWAYMRHTRAKERLKVGAADDGR